MSYNRDNVVSYAKQYAYNYNPNYIDYATYEGSSDCANFVSQCLYAGGIACFQRAFVAGEISDK